MTASRPVDAPPVHLVRAELEGVEPPIWRELLVLSAVPLVGFHLVLQTAFGWEDDHPHEWTVGGKTVRTGARGKLYDGAVMTVADALPRKGSTLGYRYDFGDDWHVKVSVLERRNLTPFDALKGVVKLLGAARAAPPEDCGGVAAFLDLIGASADPMHPRREEILESWDGEPFDAEALNVRMLAEELDGLGDPDDSYEDEDDEDAEGAGEEDDLGRMDKKTARAFASEFPYDAETDQHLKGWLELDEMERSGAVEAYHLLGNHPVGKSPKLHVIAHTIAENQLAEGYPSVASETLLRLRAAGVSRHQAVHALGSVVVEALHTTLKIRQPADLKAIEKQLRALRPADWR